jgi:hypothetical protein
VTGPTLARRLLIGCSCLDLFVGPPLLPPVSSFLHRLATPSSQVRNNYKVIANLEPVLTLIS